MSQRESIVLFCMGYSSEADVTITWNFDGQPITNSPLVSISELVTTGVVPLRQSFLQLCSVSIAQSGAYTCIVDNGMVSLQNTTFLNITGKLWKGGH